MYQYLSYICIYHQYYVYQYYMYYQNKLSLNHQVTSSHSKFCSVMTLISIKVTFGKSPNIIIPVGHQAFALNWIILEAVLSLSNYFLTLRTRFSSNFNSKGSFKGKHYTSEDLIKSQELMFHRCCCMALLDSWEFCRFKPGFLWFEREPRVSWCFQDTRKVGGRGTNRENGALYKEMVAATTQNTIYSTNTVPSSTLQWCVRQLESVRPLWLRQSYLPPASRGSRPLSS